MTELDSLHEDARRRFTELALELLELVVTFREPSSQEAPGFKPNIHHASAITDDDIIGDVHIVWKNHEGEETGIAVAQIGGDRMGLRDEGFAKLQHLAKAMAKVVPFTFSASVQFLQDQIFEWVKASIRSEGPPGCVEFVLGRLQQVAAEHRIIIPISELYIESAHEFGGVTFRTFPESFLEQFEAAQVPDGQSADDYRAECKRMRSDFQGIAVAEARAYGEPIRARQVATEQIERAVGILRFAAPAHFDPKTVSRIARWGYAPQRTAMVFLTASEDRWTEFQTSLIDKFGKTTIDDAMWGILLQAGLAEVGEILGRRKNTDLEQSLLAGMLSFGRAPLTPDLRERVVWYCSGLESVLLRNSSEPILHNLADRLAMFGYDAVTERAAAIADVRAAYSLRSDFVHHGIDIDDHVIVTRFARHGLKFFLRLAKNCKRFGSKGQLLDYIDRMKLSGGGASA